MAGFTLGQAASYGLTEQSTLDPAAPAAGASFTTVLNRYDRHRLVACLFTLTTDANAANRYVTVEYKRGGQTSFVADGAAVVVTANTVAQRYVGALNRGVAEWAAGTDIFFPLSGLWLESGSAISINVAGIQVGDTLTSIELTYDRFLIPAQTPPDESED
jgi:hypothetical protein